MKLCCPTCEKPEQVFREILMNNIDWITPEYVRQQAQKGDKEALDCSILHWTQIVEAGYDGYQAARHQLKTVINSKHCALCQRYRADGRPTSQTCVTKCPLQSCDTGSLYSKVSGADYAESAPAFEYAASALLARLKVLRAELYPTAEPPLDKSRFEVVAAVGSPYIRGYCDYLDGTERCCYLWPDGTVKWGICDGNRHYYATVEDAKRVLAAWRGDNYMTDAAREQQYKDQFELVKSCESGWCIRNIQGETCKFIGTDGMAHDVFNVGEFHWPTKRAAEAALLKFQGKPMLPRHGDVVQRRYQKCIVVSDANAMGGYYVYSAEGMIDCGMCSDVAKCYANGTYKVLDNVFE
jgi:hypothetical protein